MALPTTFSHINRLQAKVLTNINRHLINCHRNEEQVKVVLNSRTHSKARQFHMEKIRFKGNYMYNLKVLKERKGELLVVRIPNYHTISSDYVPYIHCLDFYKKREIFKHLKTCLHREGGPYIGSLKDFKLLVLNDSSLPLSCAFEKEVLFRMKEDIIAMTVRFWQISLTETWSQAIQFHCTKVKTSGSTFIAI